MKKDRHFFKVKYGFKPMDFVSVEAGGELERAIYAWTTGKIVGVGDRMINGSNIISIEPHYHKYTGWYETYEPKSGEDNAQIERDCPEFEGVLGYFRERVQLLIHKGRAQDIGKMVEIPLTQPPKLFLESISN